MGLEDPSAVMDGRVGRVLKNKWRLERLLGVGGMGAVYEGVHRNGKRVAIKILHPELSANSVQRKRFLREGYAANAIGDPRVVTVDDDDVDEDGSAFLVMELLDGESLDRAVQDAERRLPPSAVLEYVDQLLGLLEIAHAKGVVHRDIKPENLFVTKSGALKVLDFGIARLREQAALGVSDTSQMTIMGTPAYMPPEQAKGRWDRVDGRSDLWSVGATMFRLLSGRHVHEAEVRGEQLALAMTAPARSLASVAPELDERLIAVVDRALAYEIAERWQSAGEMRRALRPLLQAPAESLGPAPEMTLEDPGTTSTIEPTSAPVLPLDRTLSMQQRRRPALGESGAEPSQPRRRAVLLGGALLVLLSGAVLSALGRRAEPSPAAALVTGAAGGPESNRTTEVVPAPPTPALRNPSPPASSSLATSSQPLAAVPPAVSSARAAPRRGAPSLPARGALPRASASSPVPSARPAAPAAASAASDPAPAPLPPDRLDPLDRRR